MDTRDDENASPAMEGGDPAEAVALLRAAAAKKPDDARVQMRLGRALRDLDRPAEADAAFRRASELDPANVRARKAISETAWKLGNRSEAIADLQALAEADPGNPKLDLKLGGKLLAQLRLEDAVAAFRRVLAVEPANIVALKGLTQCVGYMGDKEEALAALRSASASEPDDARIREQIRRLEGAPGEHDWKAEARDAIATLNAADSKPGARLWSAQVLLFYGMTGPIKKALAPLESTSAPARRVLQMARQLDRMGLSNTASAPDEMADDETEQLNALKGYIERLTPGADTLVLVFSGEGDRAFLSLDIMHRMLRSTGASLVYLRDVNRSRFLGGILGLADDFPGTIEAFKAIMVRSGARRLMLVGHCGGAPAALRFGLALNAEAVLAITPRVRGRALLDNLPPREAAKWDALLKSLGRFAGDIPSLYRDSQAVPRVTLLAGAGMEPECGFSRDMVARVPGVAYAEIPGGRQDCLGVALAQGLLSPLFSSFVAEGAVAPEILESLRRPPADGGKASLESAPLEPESA